MLAPHGWPGNYQLTNLVSGTYPVCAAPGVLGILSQHLGGNAQFR